MQNWLGGGSVYDAVAKYDQFFAGFADAVTFGTSTQARQLVYGETATNNHKGIFFNLGRLGGAVTSAWIGAKGPTFAEFSSAPWWARAALGYDLFGSGLGMAEAIKNRMEGRSTWWDIIAFVPLLTWFNINYKVTTKGLSYGINGGNFNITPRNLPPLKGSGPAPGLLEVSHRTKSVAATRNYYPKKTGELTEFVFDPSTETFVVGRPKAGRLPLESPHQQLARLSGADQSVVVGGTFSRTPDGGIRTTEMSGHYGYRWNNQTRKQFI